MARSRGGSIGRLSPGLEPSLGAASSDSLRGRGDAREANGSAGVCSSGSRWVGGSKRAAESTGSGAEPRLTRRAPAASPGIPSSGNVVIRSVCWSDVAARPRRSSAPERSLLCVASGTTGASGSVGSAPTVERAELGATGGVKVRGRAPGGVKVRPGVLGGVTVRPGVLGGVTVRGTGWVNGRATECASGAPGAVMRGIGWVAAQPGELASARRGCAPAGAGPTSQALYAASA